MLLPGVENPRLYAVAAPRHPMAETMIKSSKDSSINNLNKSKGFYLISKPRPSRGDCPLFPYFPAFSGVVEK
jgi:hypothetical protein